MAAFPWFCSAIRGERIYCSDHLILSADLEQPAVSATIELTACSLSDRPRANYLAHLFTGLGIRSGRFTPSLFGFPPYSEGFKGGTQSSRTVY